MRSAPHGTLMPLLSRAPRKSCGKLRCKSSSPATLSLHRPYQNVRHRDELRGGSQEGYQEGEEGKERQEGEERLESQNRSRIELRQRGRRDTSEEAQA